VEEDAAATWQSVVTREPGAPWMAIAIVLALVLVAILIYTALVVAGVMKLGLSLI